jgi:hypothetical protein
MSTLRNERLMAFGPATRIRTRDHAPDSGKKGAYLIGIPVHADAVRRLPALTRREVIDAMKATKLGIGCQEHAAWDQPALYWNVRRWGEGARSWDNAVQNLLLTTLGEDDDDDDDDDDGGKDKKEEKAEESESGQKRKAVDAELSPPEK